MHMQATESKLGVAKAVPGEHAFQSCKQKGDYVMQMCGSDFSCVNHHVNNHICNKL